MPSPGPLDDGAGSWTSGSASGSGSTAASTAPAPPRPRAPPRRGARPRSPRRRLLLDAGSSSRRSAPRRPTPPRPPPLRRRAPRPRPAPPRPPAPRRRAGLRLGRRLGLGLADVGQAGADALELGLERAGVGPHALDERRDGGAQLVDQTAEVVLDGVGALAHLLGGGLDAGTRGRRRRTRPSRAWRGRPRRPRRGRARPRTWPRTAPAAAAAVGLRALLLGRGLGVGALLLGLTAGLAERCGRPRRGSWTRCRRRWSRRPRRWRARARRRRRPAWRPAARAAAAAWAFSSSTCGGDLRQVPVYLVGVIPLARLREVRPLDCLPIQCHSVPSCRKGRTFNSLTAGE